MTALGPLPTYQSLPATSAMRTEAGTDGRPDFTALPDAIDAYFDMVRGVASRHYSRVTRYTTSAFLRAKLGEGLLRRGVAPHIFESAEEARIGCKRGQGLA